MKRTVFAILIMKRTVFAILLVLLTSASAFAQSTPTVPVPVAAAGSGFYFPGSIWTSNGTLAPVEKGNFISATHGEQGIAWNGLEAFGQVTGGTDTQGYDWNRHTLLGVGGRFTLNVPNGNVRASLSYVTEHRYITNTQASGPVFAVEAWFGWNLSPKR